MEYQTTRQVDDHRPTIEAETSGSGARLLDKGDTWHTFIGPGCLLVFVGIFYAVFATQLLPAWASILIGAVLAAIFGSVFIKRYRIIAAMMPGELFLERWPLRRNETVRVRYFRPLKQPLAVTDVAATLKCTEQATYQQGTDTRTVSEDVFEVPLTGVGQELSMTEIQADFELKIPGSLPPSLDVYRNKIIWKVIVHVVVDGFPNDDSEFQILVGPEIVQ